MKKIFKISSLGLAIIVLQGQIALANIAGLNQSSAPASEFPQMMKPADAINSVYRVWSAIPLSNSTLYKAGVSEEIRQELDEKGIIFFGYGGKEYIFFKSKNKTYLQVSHGTAYVVSDDGAMVTNNHVINVLDEELSVIQDVFSDVMIGDNLESFIVAAIEPDFQVYPAEFIAADSKKDLAILKVSGLQATPLKLASIDHIRPADNVYAIGFPGISDEYSGGLTDPESYMRPTISNGSLKRQMNKDGIGHWEHGVDISSGSSGGPLINECAEVVGTNDSGMSSIGATLTAGAIDLNELLPLLQRHNINFNQASVACNPKVLTEPTKNQSSSIITEKTIADITPAHDKKPSNNTTLWIILGGVIFTLLALIIFLFTRKRSKPRLSTSTLSTPLSGHSSEQLKEVKTAPSYKAESRTLVKTIHLDGNYPIALYENSPFVIGRDKSCDLVIDDNKISSRHVKLLYKNSCIFVTDLQSTNGTFINGHRIMGETQLQNGDTLSLTQENIAHWNFGRNSSSGARSFGELISESAGIPSITLYAGKSLTLGRNNNNDIVINRPIVSGNHCVIRVNNDGSVEIIDNNSTNGTFIGQVNNRITRSMLNPQQVLYIGNNTICFRYKKF